MPTISTAAYTDLATLLQACPQLQSSAGRAELATLLPPGVLDLPDDLPSDLIASPLAAACLRLPGGLQQLIAALSTVATDDATQRGLAEFTAAYPEFLAATAPLLEPAPTPPAATITTNGGDVANSIDKREGAFISGGLVAGSVFGTVDSGGGQITITVGEIVPPARLLLPVTAWPLQRFLGRSHEQASLRAALATVWSRRSGLACVIHGAIGTGATAVVRAALAPLLEAAPTPILLDLAFDYNAAPPAPVARLSDMVTVLCRQLPTAEATELRPLLTVLVGQLAAQSPAVQQALTTAPGPDPAMTLRGWLRLAVQDRPLMLLLEATATIQPWWEQFLATLIADHVPELPIAVLLSVEHRTPLDPTLLTGTTGLAARLLDTGDATELPLPDLTNDEVCAAVEDDQRLGNLLWRYASGWPVLTEQVWDAWQRFGYVTDTAYGPVETRAGKALFSAHRDLFDIWFVQPWRQQPQPPCSAELFHLIMLFGALEGAEFSAAAALEAALDWESAGQRGTLRTPLAPLAAPEFVLAALAAWQGGVPVAAAPPLLGYHEGEPHEFVRLRFTSPLVHQLLLHQLDTAPRFPKDCLAQSLVAALAKCGGQHQPVISHSMIELCVVGGLLPDAKRLLSMVKEYTSLDTLMFQIDVRKRILAAHAALTTAPATPAPAAPALPFPGTWLPTAAEWTSLAELEIAAGEQQLERRAYAAAAMLLRDAYDHATAGHAALPRAWAAAWRGRLSLHPKNEEAERWLTTAESGFIRHLPDRAAHEGLAHVAITRGITAFRQNQRAAADRYYATAAIQYRLSFGSKHLGTAASLTNMAQLLYSMTDFAALRPLYEQALHITTAALGPDHPTTATSMTNLAMHLYGKGDSVAARPLFEQALRITAAALGPDHPATATSMGNLAELLNNKGHYAAARPLFEDVLRINQAALGINHPTTGTSMHNLAYLYYNIGDYAAARPLFEDALRIQQAALGPDHCDIAERLNYLATLWDKIGDYAAARPLYEDALRIRTAALGPDHWNIAESMGNLASLLERIGDEGAARPLYEDALRIYTAVLGLDHRNTRVAAQNLADLRAKLGEAA